MSPTRTATFTPDQLDALGLTGATAGQSYTITCDVTSADDSGVKVNVTDSQSNDAPVEPDADDKGGASDFDSDNPPDIAPPPVSPSPTRPKPSIVGPGRFKGKL